MRTIIVIIGLLYNLSSSANDSTAHVSTKGLVLDKTDKIAMKKERLSISPEKVEVEYEYYNESDKDISTIVAFPIPAYQCGNYYERFAFYPEFEVKVDGKILEYKKETKAFVGEKDVTPELKALNLQDGSCVDPKNLSKHQLEKLKEKNLLDLDLDGELNSIWSIQVSYYWKMTFPSKKSLKLSHSYKPVLGGNSNNSIEAKEYNKGDKFFEWARAHGVGNYPSKGKKVKPNDRGGYVLTTGNNWKNGIEDFELIVKGGQIVWVYLDNKIYSSIGRVFIKRSNYRPMTDLFFSYGHVADEIPAQFHEEKMIDGPANLRDKINGKIIVSISDKSPVVVMDFEDHWFKVKYQDKIGYTQENNLVLSDCKEK